MPSRAEPVVLGPFLGGINNYSDPSTIDDAELVDCVNFEADLDGSLVSRPPLIETVGNNAWSERIVIIGRGIFSEGNYLIGSNSNGTYAFNGTTWTSISAGLRSKVALQYQNNIWIVPQPGSPGNGGRWNPTSGFTGDPNIPQGEGAVFYKGRMFIVPGIGSAVNTSRITFTNPIAGIPFNWNSANIIDVNPGDGQKLVDIVIYDDNIMLFKEDSTYVLAYDLQIDEGLLQVVNNNIGAATRRSVAQFENALYVMHQDNVYTVDNYQFKRINEKCRFVLDITTPSDRSENTFICMVGDRLVVRYYNNIYVYGTRTDSWVRWKSQVAELHNFGPLVEMPNSLPRQYYGGSSLTASKKLFYVKATHDAITAESSPIVCSIQTKNYDFGISHHFKKMAWWGADVTATEQVIGSANPIVASYRVRWSDLATKKWSELNTWAFPLTQPSATDTAIGPEGSVSRKFLKFPRTQRFRQIYYSLTIENDGSLGLGPCRLYSLTAMLNPPKQIVPKQVN